MLPSAEIAHHSPGRVRLRIRAWSGRAERFAALETRLAQCPGVERVLVNPLTGSVLLEPVTDLAVLTAFAETERLFRLTPARSLAPPFTEQLAERFDALNDQLRRASGGGIDLGAVGFIALVTLAAVQWQRGNVLGPTTTLLWSAIALLRAPAGARRTPAES
jgi:hypothetical protein